jgi:hypothetical protein
MTIVQSLPVLWDTLGQTCRELAKQTAGVSLADDDAQVGGASASRKPLAPRLRDPAPQCPHTSHAPTHLVAPGGIPTQVTRQLDLLVRTWHRLSQSILLDRPNEYIFPAPAPAGRDADAAGGGEKAAAHDDVDIDAARGAAKKTKAAKAKARAKARQASAAGLAAASAGAPSPIYPLI